MIIAVLVLYFCLLTLVSKCVGGNDSGADFFLGNRRSPWWAVSIGMVGASVSGVSFVSVPGWVPATSFSYMQMVLGFLVGYVVVAFLLLPIYYKSGGVSIYAFLSLRLGNAGRKAGACFFLVNKLLGAAVKFYVAAYVFFRLSGIDSLPFPLFVVLCVAFVYLYTYKGGIKSIVWTDLLQTFLMVASLALLLREVLSLLGLDWCSGMAFVMDSDLSRVFFFDDWNARSYFWKHFVSGAFVVVVMTGLDQDMIQKNLSCRTLREAQRNMLAYGVLFIPVNLLFLSLGLLLVSYYGIGALPASGDDLLPYFVDGAGPVALACFSVGMLSSSFSSVDSSMTAMTTSILSDLMDKDVSSVTSAFRHKVHLCVALCVCLCVLALDLVKSEHAIDVIYQLVSYLYGPLLGMFAYCILHRKGRVDSGWLFGVTVLSPFVSYVLSKKIRTSFGYEMGYELLLLNGVLTYLGILSLHLLTSVGRKR